MQQNKQPLPPAEFQEQAIASMDAAALLAILKNPSAPTFQKAKACVRAGELGVAEAIPVLATLLANEELNVYARYGLEPMAGPAASDTLRAAIPKLKGNLLIGVINSLGKRRDAAAIPTLTRFLNGPDADLARAAAAALGSIGSPDSAKHLQAALPKSTGLTRTAIADATLVCAERFLADGKRDQALALYTALSAPSVPKAARLAAMSGIIREETSVNRPR